MYFVWLETSCGRGDRQTFEIPIKLRDKFTNRSLPHPGRYQALHMETGYDMMMMELVFCSKHDLMTTTFKEIEMILKPRSL